jgi:hypothetical protein
MRIIGYCFEADVHCPACTKARHYRGGFAVDWNAHVALAAEQCTVDEHQVPYKVIDREGNPVRPIFSTDEIDSALAFCGDCREWLL